MDGMSVASGKILAWLRGEPVALKAELAAFSLTAAMRHLAIIMIGCGLFGFTAGAWRSPIQGLFVAAKLPAILLLTASGNALINGMLAPLLGVSLDLRKSFAAILASYTIASVVLGAFAPIVGFFIWTMPPLSASAVAATAHHALLLSLIAAIAFSGVAANRRLLALLRELSPEGSAAVRLLWSWLGINFLLGSQLSWILRPFIGSPALPVQFLRADALHGNFYETVAHMLKGFFGI